MKSIIIEDIWKTYTRGKTKIGSLRNTASYFWKNRRVQQESFHALADINLSLEPGEVLGIVGPNGAGKSTLLKILSRVTFPSRGKVVINGRLSSLLEVGVGFHSELSGRDNIYLSGTIHGLRKKEIEARFEEIVDFSGQALYLDTPIKNYSSGMIMRLAFSVSAHLDPDILIMDEVLAVGDHEFKQKCVEKIKELYGQQKTILLVSHQMDTLRELCTRGISLNQGRIVHDGPIHQVIESYLSGSAFSGEHSMALRKDRKGNGEARITQIQVCDDLGREIKNPASGQPLLLKVSISAQGKELKEVSIRLNCHDMMGRQRFILNSRISNGFFALTGQQKVLTCRIPKLPLSPGKYSFDVTLACHQEVSDSFFHALEIDVAEGEFYKTGMLPKDTDGVLVDYEWELEG